MVYRNFRFVCAGLTIGLAATIALFFYLLLRTNLLITTIVVGGVVVFETWNLIRYVEKTSRDLEQLLQSVRYGDFATSFSHASGRSIHARLRAAFNEVIREFQKVRSEREEHFLFLQTIVQHVGIGLIALEGDGNIPLANSAAKRLLNVPRLRHISDIGGTRDLRDAIGQLQPGQKTLYRAEQGDDAVQLSLAATGVRLQGKILTLISIQNIGSELAERELEAWQKLVQVLTHEIINSVTPIASLAATIRGMLGSIDLPPEGERPPRLELDAEEVADILSAVTAIKQRGEGLVHFVEAYRNLSKIPKPEFKIISLGELLERVRQLIVSRSDFCRVAMAVSVSPGTLEVTVDPDLIEQVLINLVTNSCQAFQDRADGKIELKGFLGKNGRTVIQVVDNGPGIEKEVLDKIFIPFFSTKPKGTGIGLSLSRQIMRLHNGSISAHSEPNVITVFTLQL